MSNERNSGVEAALRERINGLVEEALESANKPLTMGEIEDIALKVRARIGAEVTQALVAKQAPVGVPGPVCEGGGLEMHYKGLKQRRVVVVGGGVGWGGAYLYCARRSRGER